MGKNEYSESVLGRHMFLEPLGEPSLCYDSGIKKGNNVNRPGQMHSNNTPGPLRQRQTLPDLPLLWLYAPFSPLEPISVWFHPRLNLPLHLTWISLTPFNVEILLRKRWQVFSVFLCVSQASWTLFSSNIFFVLVFSCPAALRKTRPCCVCPWFIILLSVCQWSQRWWKGLLFNKQLRFLGKKQFRIGLIKTKKKRWKQWEIHLE